MVYIESFWVSGLAGRADVVSRALDRHVNVFWGLNGAGKTTLLKLLHAAMNNESRELGDLPFQAVEVVLRLGNGAGRIVRRFSKLADEATDDEDQPDVYLSSEVAIDSGWVLVEDEGDGRGWETIVEGPEVSPRFATARLPHCYLPITRVTDNRRRGAQSYYGAGGAVERMSPDELFVQQVRERWREYSNRSLAHIRDIQQQGLAAVLAILFGGVVADAEARAKADVDAREAFELVQTFLSEQGLPLLLSRDAFESRFSTSSEHREVVFEIQEVRKDTDKVLLPQREFQSIIDALYTGNKHLVLPSAGAQRGAPIPPIGVAIGENTLPLKSLSSGEKQLLQILLETLGANGNTVMIDEPELSLHVNWQQQLVGSMERINGECQLLLATHSPEIMADLRDDFIFEL